MRVTQDYMRTLATAVTERLQAEGLLEVTGSSARLVDSLVKVMEEELSVEDRLNAEVRALLQRHDAALQSHKADYQRAFEMIKNKLVKDRGLVL